MISIFPKRFLPKNFWLACFVKLLLLGGYFFVFLMALGVSFHFLMKTGWFQPRFIRQMLHMSYKETGDNPPKLFSEIDFKGLQWTSLEGIEGAGALFRPSNVFSVHFHFASNQWASLKPQMVAPRSQLLNENVELSNPNASRNGVLGVMGFDLPWTTATEFEFSDRLFLQVATRYKGNGTMLESWGDIKRPFKVDLNKHVKGQKLLGLSTLNFHNLAADFSYLSDTLGYEYSRAVGVPAPRTAFATLALTVDEVLPKSWLGLYLMVENPRLDWAEEIIGNRDVVIFKPVTMKLFEDIGEEWDKYEVVYDAKTDLTSEDQARVMECARFFTHADSEEFGLKLSGYFDLENLARFLVSQALVGNYDGILNNGQNFLMYLDRGSGRFGFGPWDLDHAWGEFELVGSGQARIHASIREPWVGEVYFVKKVLEDKGFRSMYQTELARQLKEYFIPEKLEKRIDELAEGIRPWVMLERANRRKRFEEATTSDWAEPGDDRGRRPFDPNRPTHSLKYYIRERLKSVEQQLEGSREGIRLERNKM